MSFSRDWSLLSLVCKHKLKTTQKNDLSCAVQWFSTFATSSHKTCRIKRFLAKKQKQNQPTPQWVQMKTGNKTRYHSKRRCWRRIKSGL
ncbi:large ribosomal subunit protein eL39-like [Tenrec ecaudatus]|uniref:large ribosomal subunit protein eL39-like n=1 Tax=Tenrec ecaudatus TaxID=94439 RepID=UPI003F591400